MHDAVAHHCFLLHTSSPQLLLEEEDGVEQKGEVTRQVEGASTNLMPKASSSASFRSGLVMELYSQSCSNSSCHRTAPSNVFFHSTGRHYFCCQAKEAGEQSAPVDTTPMLAACVCKHTHACPPASWSYYQQNYHCYKDPVKCWFCKIISIDLKIHRNIQNIFPLSFWTHKISYM